MSEENLIRAEQNEQTIFDEKELLNSDYNKHVNQARNTMFIIAGVQILSGLISTFRVTPDALIYVWAEVLIIAAVFVVLGLWTKKKPYSAIIGALILYALFIILNAVIDINSIYKGILFKIMIIVFLVKGINDAREAQRMQDEIGK